MAFRQSKPAKPIGSSLAAGRGCSDSQTFFNIFRVARVILKIADGRARGDCAVALWQGGTTRRPRARKAEQYRQRATVRRHRVHSAFTHKVMGLV
jgi:hypothetical protein